MGSIIPIIYDADGSLIDAIVGEGARFFVIGFAGPEYADLTTATITEGMAVLNGAFIDGSPPDFTFDQFKATFIHEFGHLIGLDHTQINPQFASDEDITNDDYLPTMFPTATDDDTKLAPSTLTTSPRSVRSIQSPISSLLPVRSLARLSDPMVPPPSGERTSLPGTWPIHCSTPSLTSQEPDSSPGDRAG